MAKKPDYRKIYDNYHGTEEQKKNRASRNAARREAIKKGIVRKGDGKEIDHKDGNPRNNSPSNLQVLSRRANRSKGG